MRIVSILAVCSAPACVIVPTEPGGGGVAERPFVTGDTRTTPAGDLRVELGGDFDLDGPFALPATLRIGAGPHTELALEGPLLARADLPGHDDVGLGDLSVVLRQRVLVETEEWPAAALELRTKLPTGNEGDGLSSGEIDFSAAGIATRHLGAQRYGARYELEFLGEPGSGDPDIGHRVALSTVRIAEDPYHPYGEIAFDFVPERDVEALFASGGVFFQPRGPWVFDLGVAVGLTSDAPDFRILLGVSRWIPE